MGTHGRAVLMQGVRSHEKPCQPYVDILTDRVCLGSASRVQDLDGIGHPLSLSLGSKLSSPDRGSIEI